MKRREERAYMGLLDAMESVGGGNSFSKQKPDFVRGAEEIDLVNSGLEETMAVAYREIRELRNRLGNDVDLRTSAMVTAINKVAVTYEELGIFP